MKTIANVFQIFITVCSYLFSLAFMIYQIYYGFWDQRNIIDGKKPLIPPIEVFYNFEFAFTLTFWFMILYIFVFLIFVLIGKIAKERLVDFRNILWAFAPPAALLLWEFIIWTGLIITTVISVLYLIFITVMMYFSVNREIDKLEGFE